MGLYICLWGSYCISFTFSTVSWSIYYSTDSSYEKYRIPICISDDLISMSFTVLDCLILYTLLRMSNSVEQKYADKISQELTKTFSNQGRDKHSSEEMERMRFERRHTEYKFIADEQTKAIMTAMSISYIKGFPEHVVGIVPEPELPPSDTSQVVTYRSLTVATELDENVLFLSAFSTGVQNLLASQNQPVEEKTGR